MKKLLAVLVIMMAVSVGAQAQESLKHKDHGKGHKKEMYKELNLSDEQKKQAKQVNQDFKTKMEALKKDDKITVGEMKEKKAALMQERQEAFKNLLNADQKVKFEEQQKQAREQHKMHHAKKDV